MKYLKEFSCFQIGNNCRRLHRGQHKISQHHGSQHDPVPAEHPEIMFFDIGDEELDRQDGDDKSHRHAQNQDRQLISIERPVELRDL